VDFAATGDAQLDVREEESIDREDAEGSGGALALPRLPGASQGSG